MLYLPQIKSKTKMLQKQMKENGVCLFYNNSSASCLYWFIFRNNTLHLFLVPHPFKIEASLQNSLSLQCTYLCIFDISQCMDFLSCWPGSPVQLKQVLWPLKPAIPLKQISSFSTLPYVLLFNKTEKKRCGSKMFSRNRENCDGVYPIVKLRAFQ